MLQETPPSLLGRTQGGCAQRDEFALLELHTQLGLLQPREVRQCSNVDYGFNPGLTLVILPPEPRVADHARRRGREHGPSILDSGRMMISPKDEDRRHAINIMNDPWLKLVPS